MTQNAGTASFNRLFGGGALQRPAHDVPNLRAHRAINLDARAGRDEVRGVVEGGAKSAGSSGSPPKLSRGLDKRLGAARRFGFRAGQAGSGGFDARQRAIVKLHFFGHGGGGAAALGAHARYVARDAARGPDGERTVDVDAPSRDGDTEARTRAHAAYLEREKGSPFYDALENQVDGAARAAVWAREDKRHFRIILAAERGEDLKDLRAYTRKVMARAEAALGTRLDWVAVDHYDTDNAHTHIILRGRRGDGRVLIIPRDFVQHGFRNAARDVATDRLGERTRADERLALMRETRAHRPTRLDALLAPQIDAEGRLRIADIRAQSPDLQRALKARARELERLGMAGQVRRNVLIFRSTWRAELSAMEMHLDVRKQIMRARTPERLNLPKTPRRGMLGR